MTGPRPSRDVAAAVSALLDRVQDPAELREATDRVAHRASTQELQTRSIFIFRLGSEWLGLDSSIVDEVLGPRMIHALPHRRDGVMRGLVNVRGQLTICVALERLFEVGAVAKAEVAPSGALGQRLVVLASQGNRLAFEVDEAHGTHRFDPAGLGGVPATVVHAVASFTTGMLQWGDRTVGVLDAGLVLHALGRRLA